MAQLRTQAVASDVHTRVKKAFAELDQAAAQDYDAYAQELGFLVRENGLAQTLAYLAHKGNKEPASPGAKRLLEDVMQQIGVTTMETVRLASNAEYMRLTREVLAAAGWYKRFSDTQTDSQQTEHAEKRP